MCRFMGSVIIVSGLLAGCQDAATVNEPEVSDVPPPGRTTVNETPRDMEIADREPRTVTANKVIDETGEAADAAGEYAAQTKDEYVEKLSAKMAEYDDEIAAMNQRAAELQGDAAAEWNQQTERLQIQRAELQETLDHVRASSGEAWRDLKASTDQLWTNFKGELNAAGEKLDAWSNTDVDVDVDVDNSDDSPDVREVPVEEESAPPTNSPPPANN